MIKSYYKGSYLGSSIVLILVLLLGGAISLIIFNKWNMETGATVALMVAAGAFFSNFYHFYALRKHQRLSVKPFLQISSTFESVTKEGFYTYSIKLENAGLGPAVIEEKNIVLGETKTNDVMDEFEEWVKLVNRITPANGNAECRSGRCDVDHAIDKGTRIDLLAVNFPKQDMSFMDARDVAAELSRQIQISIKYKSHYEQSYQCVKQIT